MAYFRDRSSNGSERLRMISRRTSDKVARVRKIADKSLADAKAAYEREFGVKHTDKTIDGAHADALSQAINRGQAFVKIPVEVSLALWLRRAARPEGRTPLDKYALRTLMIQARRLKREIMDEYPVNHVKHVRADEAAERVARKFLARSGIKTVERFVYVMDHTRLWR